MLFLAHNEQFLFDQIFIYLFPQINTDVRRLRFTDPIRKM